MTQNTAAQTVTILGANVPIGSWSKPKGAAHYVVTADGAIVYVNRRGEAKQATVQTFAKAWANGCNAPYTPMDLSGAFA